MKKKLKLSTVEDTEIYDLDTPPERERFYCDSCNTEDWYRSRQMHFSAEKTEKEEEKLNIQ